MESIETREAKLPWVPPQLATLVQEAPDGPEWIHEQKYDGYRILAYIADGKVTLLTRNRKDWTERFHEVASACKRLKVKRAIIDGEVCAIDEHGHPSFQALQSSVEGGPRRRLVYFAFDILHLDGYSLRKQPLIDRKELLQRIIRKGRVPTVRFSDHIEGPGRKLLKSMCSHALEGIISKQCAAPYSSGRGVGWVKTKCSGREEFVIIGYTPHSRISGLIGALLVGQFEGERLRYCGKVGTGFKSVDRERLFRLLSSNCVQAVSVINAKFIPKHSIFAEPRYVAELQFTEWTRDGMLRHPSFLGLREDKSAKQVTSIVSGRARNRRP